MKPNRSKQIIIFTILLIAGAALTAWMLYAFNNIPGFKALFSAADTPVLGNVGPESEVTLAQKADFTAKVSMWIFIFITLLQLAALGVGYAVVNSIASSDDNVKLKLRRLDNAEN